MENEHANNLYDSICNGKSAPLSKELQEEFDKITEACEKKVAAMTDDEKIAEFNKIMGRVQ